jgi:hypothetical protein
VYIRANWLNNFWKNLLKKENLIIF